MTNKSDLISSAFRTDFREFCVSFLVLRQIDDAFVTSGVRKGRIASDRVFSGQRRTLVEEYYGSLNWTKPEDAEKFLNAVQFAYAQSYRGNDEGRSQLKLLLEREGYTVEGWKIKRLSENLKSQSHGSTYDIDQATLKQLAHKLIEMNKLEPQRRGFEFERLLNEIFAAFHLEPRGSFRLVGEQIDGSFQLGSDVYLIEAKWQSQQTGQNDLLAFKGKVEGKSTWTRGLFISYGGFSLDGQIAFSRGRPTNIIGMDGQDLYFVLEEKITLTDAILRKVRRAAETGEFFVPVFELIH